MTSGLRAALDTATRLLHYAENHRSVRLGNLIATCTDGRCPEFRGALEDRLAPEIVCLCGDVFRSVEATHDHIHMVHDE